MIVESARVRRRRRTRAIYHGADLHRAQLFALAAWSLGLVAMAVLAACYPPDRHGLVGWWLLAAELLLLLGALVRCALLRSGFTEILLQQYLAVIGVGALQWCAGGWRAPYQQLVGALLLFISLVHPRARALPLVLLTAAFALLPATYGAARPYAASVLVDLLVGLGTAAIASELITMVRRQRLELAAGGDAARADARRDELTGLRNRRAFVERVRSELEDSRSTGQVLSLAVGDVDDFKKVNDDFGHMVGDACLVAIGRALERAVRPPDSVFRWGGDEFAVLLRGANDAASTAARLEDAVATVVATPDGLPVCVTFGVVVDDLSGGPDELLAAADAALLAGKRRHQPRSRGPLVARQRAGDAGRA